MPNNSPTIITEDELGNVWEGPNPDYRPSNLTPGKKPLGGKSTRISAYFYPGELRLIEKYTEGMTPYEKSRKLALWILAGMQYD